jgi:hypothetical protein
MTRPQFSLSQFSLPSLKPLRAGLPAAAPLGLALAAALVGHGLLLAHNPWRRSPAKAQVLTAEDTTPELLRFSRRMPQEMAATTIPLPPAMTLPPPPPDLLDPLPKKDAKPGRQPPETKGGKIQPTLQLKLSKTSSPGAHGGAKAHSKPGQAAKEPGAKGGSKAAKGAPASSPTAEAAGTMPLALAPSPLRLSPSPPAEALQRWRDLRASAEAAPPTTSAAGPGSESLKASEAAPYLRLWDQAAPAAFAAGTDSALSEGVQARRLPLAAARALGLDPGQQQWLKAADQSLLVWIDGPNLWLLKGPIPPEKPGN